MIYVTLNVLNKRGNATPTSFPLDGLRFEKTGAEQGLYVATVSSPAGSHRVMIPPGQPIPTSGEPTNS